MTKLTKSPPPAYPGKAIPQGSLQTAVPYESLPQGTQQPVPVTTAVLPSSYHDPLPDTNPFSPNFRPGPASTATPPPTTATFSPVSPIAESGPIERPAEAPVQAPTPQRPNGDQRQSVDLRRLDGKPYPGSNSAPEKQKPKVVKVAKDMHDGALPPVYRRQASDPINPTVVTDASSDAHKCGKCGKKPGQGDGHGHSCNQCGKRKSNVTASTPPAAAPAPMPTATAHARTISEGQASHGSSRLSESTAGPSSSPGSSTGTRCCTKCGRYKRPSPVPNPFDQLRPNGSGPATAPVPMANHPAMRLGLSIQPNAPANNPAYPKIDVIPPSASTYRAVNSPFTTYGDDSPLVGKATKQEFKLFRNSSLARSLSRRLSKKDKTVPSAAAPLPSQQLARQSGEQSAGILINMISSAMQGPGSERDAPYTKLSAGSEQADRPETPFSFVGGKDEQDAFEMVDLRDRASVSSQDSMKEVVKPEISVTPSDSEFQSGVPDHIDVIPRSKSEEVERNQHLSVNGADKGPPVTITRFKSLRQGVSRMGSVSRSTSLKRLGSLKTVHHAWYVEGTDGNNENIVPVF
ncbi:uncharacterized protein Z520_10226 [Fonsecaea multimorphosa CBS 102226]|uniref:Uncharacterized protein n=1 Tax=Fonsecaea multimorphosa CBS 102226 TaxID=1442371 RepID=A0A0D2JUK7_9EURO|nr:uncharacterized protein Z520_10226 [Fonsecaea multimorphosa CBS 102226]KIX94199.1 hypothetical protein Z520_10226 [Fonsecaea multimorphosa CBS 102226]OAL19550.1 hypothetical protein AYO22_09712 [Fonsecaea multimorphosa]